MDLKNLSPHTRRSYLNAVTKLAKHYRQSPETITEEMIEDYLLYLKNEKGNALATCCITLSGLRFFYKHILGQQISIGFSLPKTPRKLPSVLTKQQVRKVICAPGNLKHRLILMTTYSAGLRVGEARRLMPDHTKAKGGEGRVKLTELRHYYQACVVRKPTCSHRLTRKIRTNHYLMKRCGSSTRRPAKRSV